MTRTCGILLLLLWSTMLRPATAQGPPDDVALDLVILVDRSGSMGGPQGTDPRGLTKSAVLYLIDQADLGGSQNRVAIVPFATDVSVVPGSGLTAEFDGLRKAAAGIPTPGGLTDLEKALETAHRLLTPFDDGRRKEVVIVTDGDPFPDPRDRNRFPEIARQFLDRSASVPRVSQRFNELLLELSTKAKPRSLQAIRSVWLAQFQDRVEVYPVALTDRGLDVDLLREIARVTTRDPEGFKIVKQSLIADIEAIVPKMPNLHTIYHNAAEPTEGRRSFSKSFAVETHISRLRVLVNYRVQDRRWKDIRVSVVGPDGKRLTREEPSPSSYLGARDQDGEGNMVFERFLVETPQPGSWTVAVDAASATTVLPPLDVLVEGRTSLRLAVNANPPTVEQDQTTVLLASVVAPVGAAPRLAAADGQVRRPDGTVRVLSFSRSATGALGAEWRAHAPGSYWVRVRGYLDAARTQGLSGGTSFRVVLPQPVELRVEIPFGAP